MSEDLAGPVDWSKGKPLEPEMCDHMPVLDLDLTADFWMGSLKEIKEGVPSNGSLIISGLKSWSAREMNRQRTEVEMRGKRIQSEQEMIRKSQLSKRRQN